MSDVGKAGRSYVRIRPRDLDRLAQLAAHDREVFFAAHPEWARFYSDRFIGSALCQGAALHYVDGKTGVQDFDVWSFFEANPKRRWYAKRNKHVDFGDARFGKSPDRPDLIGRRVDLLGRAIDRHAGESASACLRRWIVKGTTDSALLLAKKPVVILDPPEHRGEVVWRPKRLVRGG